MSFVLDDTPDDILDSFIFPDEDKVRNSAKNLAQFFSPTSTPETFEPADFLFDSITIGPVFLGSRLDGRCDASVPPNDPNETISKTYQQFRKCLAFWTPSRGVSGGIKCPDIRTKLKAHQDIGLRRMMLQEQTFHASLLSDRMGLGKTLTIIAFLNCMVKRNESSGPTLIVVPKPLISQWHHQFRLHTDMSNWKVVFYSNVDGCDDANSMAVRELRKMDIVVTTMGTVVSERTSFEKAKLFYENGRQFKKRKVDPSNSVSIGTSVTRTPTFDRVAYDPVEHLRRRVTGAEQQTPRPHDQSKLYSLDWERVVVDEAHMIKNHSSRRAEAICALSRKSSIGITGTPFMNDYRDIHGLFSFFNLAPWNEREAFLSMFLPVKQTGRTNTYTLPAALRMDVLLIIFWAILICREKGSDMDMPQITRRDEWVDLDDSEKWEGVIGRGGDRNNAQWITEAETQNFIRKVHMHKWPGLFEEHDPAFRDRGEQPEDTHAADYFAARINTKHPSAYMAYVDRDCEEDDKNEEDAEISRRSKKIPREWIDRMNAPDAWASTMMLRFVRVVEEILYKPGSKQKIVVFDEFLSTIELAGIALYQNDIEFVEVSGRMKERKRTANLNRFQTDDTVRVLIASTRSIGTGTNLQCASTCILFGSTYTPQQMEQVIARIVRMDQPDDCTIVILRAKNSIDEWMLRTHAQPKDRNRDRLMNRKLRYGIEWWKTVTSEQFLHVIPAATFSADRSSKSMSTIDSVSEEPLRELIQQHRLHESGIDHDADDCQILRDFFDYVTPDDI